MSEKYMEEFSNALVSMLEGKDNSPHEVGYVTFVAGRQINDNSLDLSWYPNTHTRFHEVSISLPKDRIITCIGCWQYDLNPYIFVKDDWLERLYTREYSVFALIDAIGVKEAIRNNLLTKELLVELRNRIDALAEQHSDISFISFADSLILKSNWSVGYFHKGIECSYEPESILKIICEIREIYRDVLGLDIYSVVTQGSNEYYEEPLLHISQSKNHICLNSLGVPFAELLAIESAAKSAIKNGTHGPSELYMDEQYYHSLNFEFEYGKNDKPKNTYRAIMKTEVPNYFYASCSDIMLNLRSDDE
ncbi:hypothetical protein [uncultured Methylophaga sp.]|uniref:hypothetical protein n=1 Tax=uncultured Methylophaga sp. TaxID=285271 RepID=UPI002625B2E4|nr:hypothetical protein [uncultured Methylophaga sp.]